MHPLVKKIALYFLSNNFLLQRKIKFLHSKKDLVTILNLHSVANNTTKCNQLTPKLFEELILFLKKNFTIVSFSDLKRELITDKPLIILSFDDGYKDFIDYVVPILEKYNIKCNQNIIPNCIESQLPPINVIVQDFICQAPEKLLKTMRFPEVNINKYTNNRSKLGVAVSAYIKNRPMQEQKLIYDEIKSKLFDFEDFKPTPMMSIDEVLQVIDNHEIGAHSYEHASINYETKEYFKKDLKKCKNYFNNQLNTEVNTYAFPNGSYSEDHISIAAESGFEEILLVNDKFSNINNRVHDRFGFDAHTINEVYFRATGSLCWP